MACRDAARSLNLDYDALGTVQPGLSEMVIGKILAVLKEKSSEVGL